MKPAPKGSIGRLPLVARIRPSQIIRGALPRPVMNALREFKLRILMRGFRNHIVVEQSAEDALASQTVSIIVPIHDSPAVTRRCLTSLEKYATKAEIILVDDGSKLAETRSLIREFVDRNGWRLIQHQNPLGHSLASEAGVKISKRPYLCLLNSDTVVTPFCWRLVKEAFERDQSIAVAGPATSSSGNIQTLPIAQYLREELNDYQISQFALHLLGESRVPICEDLAWASGFAFFVRRSVWDQLGGFDQNLPDYGNEIELCRRVADMGHRRVWVSNAYIHHLGGQSYGSSIRPEGIISRTEAAWAYIAGKERAPEA
jgi:GT2 family glycosyltransferase